MSKRIEEIALEIARRRKNGQTETIKQKIINKMQEDFNERTEQLKPWESIVGKDGNEPEIIYVFGHYYFDDIESDDVIKITSALGFRITDGTDAEGRYSIAIPEWVKGTKRTPAQLMLYKSNVEINRKIKALKAQAKEACNKVFEKIEQGDFKSFKQKDVYHISVEMEYPENCYKTARHMAEFETEAKRIFEKKKFRNIIFDEVRKTCQFDIADTQEKN